MTANRERPHILVLPEDDQDRALAVGFQLVVKTPRQMQIEPVVGGWTHVRDRFLTDHLSAMYRYPTRIAVLLIDFDGRGSDRLQAMRVGIPDDIADRVFVIGSKEEPKDLKQAFGRKPLETIGSDLADECRNGTDILWSHDLLIHNKAELERLHRQVGSWLF